VFMVLCLKNGLNGYHKALSHVLLHMTCLITGNKMDCIKAAAFSDGALQPDIENDYMRSVPFRI
jgi:hypothetical protein